MAVVVDVAGGLVGGAARLLAELDAFLATCRQDVLVVGRERGLSPAWLVQRELLARRQGANRVVALNNVSYVGAAMHRTVLLRNALHFPVDDDVVELPPGVRRRVAAEAAVVRALARRATLVVVPSSSMAARVRSHLPHLDQVVVRAHPVSPRPRQPMVPGRIVCPVLLAPYKRMGVWLNLLDQACRLPELVGKKLEVLVTASEAELQAEGVRPGVIRGVGQLPVAETERLLATANAVFYPTALESFGYPLAEARANGQPVVALRNAHNQEVAGPALCSFEPDAASLALAIELALAAEIAPTTASDSLSYFTQLLGLA